ncbi:MAG: YjfB family protein [Lachnospiraceae bacterium]|nr:YjfB family protein [Lachnospiraceae bacterium]
MDISEISVSMNQTSLMTAVSTAVLGMSLDMVETSGENMVKMMELSVNPNIGSNIDVSV